MLELHAFQFVPQDNLQKIVVCKVEKLTEANWHWPNVLPRRSLRHKFLLTVFENTLSQANFNPDQQKMLIPRSYEGYQKEKWKFPSHILLLTWWLNQDDWIYLLSHITFTFHLSFHFYFPSHFYIAYSCGQLSQVAVFKSASFRACINETREKVFCPNPAWPSLVWTPSWAETPEAAAVTDYSVFRPGAERGPHHTAPHTRRQKAIHSLSWMETFRGLKIRVKVMILNTRVKDLGDEKVSVLTAI